MLKPKIKVLYVEDDSVLGYIVTDFLQKQDFEVIHCLNGEMAWSQFMKNEYDICLLDILLPGKKNGIELAKNIRSKNEQVPIILLSSQNVDEVKIDGFDSGADDYLTKPFNFQELLRRMGVFLKRTKKTEDVGPLFFKIDELDFDYTNLLLKSDRLEFQLTEREADILRYLCMNSNRLIKRKELLMTVWGKTDQFLGRSMDVFIARIRKYLKSQKNVSLQTVRGIGLRFNYNSDPPLVTE